MRYEGEAHLQFFGPYEQCTRLIPQARAFLGEILNQAKLLDTPQGLWVYKTLPDGSVIRAWTGYPPIIQIYVDIESREFVFGGRYHFVLPWQPEGILLTPRSAAGNTLGLPMRDQADPLGTPLESYTQNGVYPQILINRFANNKYLDDLDYMSGLPDDVYEDVENGLLQTKRNPRLNDQYLHAAGSQIPSDAEPTDIRFEYAVMFGFPASYASDTSEGFYEFDYTFEQLEGGVFELQELRFEVGSDTYPAILSKKVADADTVYEEEADEWYTHRPEELLYEFAIQEGIYQRTNFFRTEDGVAPAGNNPYLRSLRGNAPAGYWGCYEIGTSEANYWGHSHPEFRPGMRTAGGRNMVSTGQEFGANTANNPCENAVAVIAVEGANALEKGDYVTQIWRDSPGHYGVMISGVFEPGVRATNLNYYGGGRGLDGTTLDVGSYVISVNFDTYFDVNSGDVTQDLPFWNETPWTFGKSKGWSVYTEIFQQREAWLPVPEFTRKTPLGSIGRFTNPSVWAGFPSNIIRSFSLGPRLYEIPFGTVPAAVDTGNGEPVFDPETDPFLGLIGAWPYEVDDETAPSGKTKYIRLVCVEGDINILNATVAVNTVEYPVGNYVDVVTYILPAALSDTGRLSWENPKYQSFQEESRQKFGDVSGGLLAIAPTHVEFSEDGSRFVFQMYELATTAQTGRTTPNSFDWSFDDPLGDFYENTPYPSKGIKPRAVEWRDGNWIIQPSQPEVVFEVLENKLEDGVPWFNATTGSNEVIEKLRTSGHTAFVNTAPKQDVFLSRLIYKGQCVGGYDMFPHYRGSSKSISYVRVVNNEYHYVDELRIFDPVSAPAYPTEGSYGWIQRKMVYPDGEEFIYQQQYWDEVRLKNHTATIDDVTYDPASPNEDDPYLLDTNSFLRTDAFGYASILNSSVGKGAPGDGTQFVCVIHNWDVRTKEMVYQKEIPKETYWWTTVEESQFNLDADALNKSPGDLAALMRVVQCDSYINHYDGAGNTTEIYSYIPVQPSISGVQDFDDGITENLRNNPDTICNTIANEPYSSGGGSGPFLLSQQAMFNPQNRNGTFLLNTVDNTTSPTLIRKVQQSEHWAQSLSYSRPIRNGWEVELTDQLDFSTERATTATDLSGATIELIDRMTFQDFSVSCCCNVTSRFSIATNIAGTWIPTEGAIGQRLNFAPMFNQSTVQKTNLMSYKGRWVVRFRAIHYPTIMGVVAQNTINTIGDPGWDDTYFWLPDDLDPSAGDRLTVVGANFNLAAASGLPDVADVFPCAVLE